MPSINTVLGNVELPISSIIFPHEHIYCDFSRREPPSFFDKAVRILNRWGFRNKLRTIDYNSSQCYSESISASKYRSNNEIIDVLKPKFSDFKSNNIWGIVDLTPIGIGRNVKLIQEISKLFSINIIVSTGFYRDFYIPLRYRNKSVDEFVDIMTKEITKGIGGTNIKAGVIKVATSFDEITDLEKRIILSASIVHKNTGIPIYTHTEAGTMGEEQINIFKSKKVDLSKVCIGHCGQNMRIDYHIKLARQGVFIGYDNIGWNEYMDNFILLFIKNLIAKGYEKQILLSHDIVGYRGDSSEQSTVKYSYIITDFIPKMKKRGISDDVIDLIIKENPLKFLTK